MITFENKYPCWTDELNWEKYWVEQIGSISQFDIRSRGTNHKMRWYHKPGKIWEVEYIKFDYNDNPKKGIWHLLF